MSNHLQPTSLDLSPWPHWEQTDYDTTAFSKSAPESTFCQQFTLIFTPQKESVCSDRNIIYFGPLFSRSLNHSCLCHQSVMNSSRLYDWCWNYVLERHVSHITTSPEMSLVTEHWENKLYYIEIYTQQLQQKCKCKTSTSTVNSCNLYCNSNSFKGALCIIFLACFLADICNLTTY